MVRIGSRSWAALVLGWAVVLTPSALADDGSLRVDPNGYDPTVVGGPAPIVDVPRLDALPNLADFVPNMGPSPEFAGRMARIAGGFIQRDPEDGEPSPQRTDVYMAYDDRHLVVVFVAFDDEPNRIRAHMAQRERVFQDEIVEIQLDTFLDRRRAYTFVCNPLGVQFDAIRTDGEGGGPGGGGIEIQYLLEVNEAIDQAWDHEKLDRRIAELEAELARRTPET